MSFVRTHNIFNFGKYRGYTAGEVASVDPSYIYWLSSNSRDVDFSEGVMRKAMMSRRNLVQAGMYPPRQRFL